MAAAINFRDSSSRLPEELLRLGKGKPGNDTCLLPPHPDHPHMPSTASTTHCPQKQAKALHTLADSLRSIIGSLISIDLIDVAEYVALIKYDADALAADVEHTRQQQEKKFPHTDDCAQKIETFRARCEVLHVKVAELKARESGVGEGRQNAEKKVAWEEMYKLQGPKMSWDSGDSDDSDDSEYSGESAGMGKVAGSSGALSISKAA